MTTDALRLGVDAGGSSTRAVLLDASGRCRGLGAAGSGNPRSTGRDGAVRALAAAVGAALDAAGAAASSVAGVVVAMAGARSLGTAGDPIASEGLAAAGVDAPVEVDSDILAMFRSGTWVSSGYVVVAGTGAAAVRVVDDRVDAVADGMGWLLGDEGSGFWIGHRVVRAVVADLDGRGPSTRLTPLVLARLGLDAADDAGRTPLARLVEWSYAAVPVRLAQLAPIAFQADDEVAAGIVQAAGEALAHTLGTVMADAGSAPLVLGGSVLHHQPAVASAVESAFRRRGGGGPVTTVSDGVAGTAVLALRRGGVDVDRAVFERVHASLGELRMS